MNDFIIKYVIANSNYQVSFDKKKLVLINDLSLEFEFNTMTVEFIVKGD